MKTYSNFKYHQIVQWRAIPLSTVIKVANASHSGSDYRQSSKSDIYEAMDSGRYNGSSKPNIKLFEEMMDIFTSIHCRAAEKLDREVNETIRDIIKFRPT